MPRQRKDYDEAVAMYERGSSTQAVAAAFGVSTPTMWHILKRRSVVFRTVRITVRVSPGEYDRILAKAGSPEAVAGHMRDLALVGT